jgi:hypothetical protein
MELILFYMPLVQNVMLYGTLRRHQTNELLATEMSFWRKQQRNQIMRKLECWRLEKL